MLNYGVQKQFNINIIPMEIYCVRCNKKHRIKDNAVRNAEVYGSNVYACPYCGKAYRLQRVVRVDAIPINTEAGEDDWGKNIYSDEEYNQIKNNSI